jgi:2-C-methyl-D-erythritol 4-phosphate cytidylyltransferase
MNQKQNIWVIIPAAGVGRRMQTDVPKQYLILNDKTVIEHTINVFTSVEFISGIIVAISKDDEYWTGLDFNVDKRLHTVDGGDERCYSVLNALKFLQKKAQPNDWVLVHDAARPCLRTEDLNLLVDKLKDHDVGGILAIPVRDTMKRSDKSLGKNQDTEHDVLIEETVDREGLWHALTPQMFRFGLLYDALEAALSQGKLITDESSALELAGYHPVLVEGHADNIKITHPDDLTLAAFYLKEQEITK